MTKEILQRRRNPADTECMNSGKPLVLVIDDDPQAREVASYLLETEFDTLTADGDEEALLLAHRRKPAAILCDVQMPILNGSEMIFLLKASDRTAHIPIVLMSGGLENAMESRASGFVQKPFSAEAMKDVIRRSIEPMPQTWTG
jgi:CheY-like chemotaxis protein